MRCMQAVISFLHCDHIYIIDTNALNKNKNQKRRIFSGKNAKIIFLEI